MKLKLKKTKLIKRRPRKHNTINKKQKKKCNNKKKTIKQFGGNGFDTRTQTGQTHTETEMAGETTEQAKKALEQQKSSLTVPPTTYTLHLKPPPSQHDGEEHEEEHTPLPLPPHSDIYANMSHFFNASNTTMDTSCDTHYEWFNVYDLTNSISNSFVEMNEIRELFNNADNKPNIVELIEHNRSTLETYHLTEALGSTSDEIFNNLQTILHDFQTFDYVPNPMNMPENFEKLQTLFSSNPLYQSLFNSICNADNSVLFAKLFERQFPAFVNKLFALVGNVWDNDIEPSLSQSQTDQSSTPDLLNDYLKQFFPNGSSETRVGGGGSGQDGEEEKKTPLMSYFLQQFKKILSNTGNLQALIMQMAHSTKDKTSILFNLINTTLPTEFKTILDSLLSYVKTIDVSSITQQIGELSFIKKISSFMQTIGSFSRFTKFLSYVGFGIIVYSYMTYILYTIYYYVAYTILVFIFTSGLTIIIFLALRKVPMADAKHKINFNEFCFYIDAPLSNELLRLESRNADTTVIHIHDCDVLKITELFFRQFNDNLKELRLVENSILKYCPVPIHPYRNLSTFVFENNNRYDVLDEHLAQMLINSNATTKTLSIKGNYSVIDCNFFAEPIIRNSTVTFELTNFVGLKYKNSTNDSLNNIKLGALLRYAAPFIKDSILEIELDNVNIEKSLIDTMHNVGILIIRLRNSTIKKDEVLNNLLYLPSLLMMDCCDNSSFWMGTSHNRVQDQKVNNAIVSNIVNRDNDISTEQQLQLQIQQLQQQLQQLQGSTGSSSSTTNSSNRIDEFGGKRRGGTGDPTQLALATQQLASAPQIINVNDATIKQTSLTVLTKKLTTENKNKGLILHSADGGRDGASTSIITTDNINLPQFNAPITLKQEHIMVSDEQTEKTTKHVTINPSFAHTSETLLFHKICLSKPLSYAQFARYIRSNTSSSSVDKSSFREQYMEFCQQIRAYNEHLDNTKHIVHIWTDQHETCDEYLSLFNKDTGKILPIKNDTRYIQFLTYLQRYLPRPTSENNNANRNFWNLMDALNPTPQNPYSPQVPIQEKQSWSSWLGQKAKNAKNVLSDPFGVNEIDFETAFEKGLRGGRRYRNNPVKKTLKKNVGQKTHNPVKKSIGRKTRF